MDGNSGDFTSSVDNVFQQSLSGDATQAADWLVSCKAQLVNTCCHDKHLQVTACPQRPLPSTVLCLSPAADAVLQSAQALCSSSQLACLAMT